MMKYIDCQTFAFFAGYLNLWRCSKLISWFLRQAFLSYLESTKLSTRSYLCKPCQKFKVEKLNKFMNWLRAGQGVCLRCVGCCTGWQKRLHCVCYHHVLSKVHRAHFSYYGAICLRVHFFE